MPASNLMGGSAEYSYTYDDLYRLTTAIGNFKGPQEQDRYSLTMEYNNVGSITRKTQSQDKANGKNGNKWVPQKKTTYDLSYTYGPQQPHAATHIGTQTYTYDADGNQTGWTSDLTGQRQNLVWDEENRLRSVSVNGQLNSYVYDAAVERVLKGQGSGQSVFVNGDLKAGSGGVGNFTVYVNPYLVVQSGQYSKHYFIESQRITTRLEQGWQQQVEAPAAGDTIAFSKKEQKLLQGIARDQQAVQGTGQQPVTAVTGPDARGVASSNGQAVGTGNGNGNGTTGGSADSTNNGNHYAYGHDKNKGDNSNQSFLYFYHPDHLGSTSYVTDDAGEVYEHMEYFAFGETFVQEHSNTDRIPYLFNGKELDEETGLYYYGARYYDPRTSIWQSVDPKADQRESPYAAMGNNPVRYNDPLGDTIIDAQIKADKNWGKAYSTWLNSKAGKSFVKLYSPGGKNGKTTVQFKVGQTGNNGSAEATTDVYDVNRKTGSEKKLETDHVYSGIDKVSDGKSATDYLKFTVTVRDGNQSNTPEQQIENAESILHETQHVRIDQQTLSTNRQMAPASYQHYYWMKPMKSDWYKERAGFYMENRNMWQADYGREKAQGRATTEAEYIRSKVNDFIN